MFKNWTCWCLTSPHLLVGAFLGAPFVPLSSPTFTPHQVIIWFWWCGFCGALPWTSLDWVPTTSAEVQELLLLCARFVPRPGKLMGQECIEVDTIGWYWMLRNGQPVSTWTPPMWRKNQSDFDRGWRLPSRNVCRSVVCLKLSNHFKGIQHTLHSHFQDMWPAIERAERQVGPKKWKSDGISMYFHCDVLIRSWSCAWF